MQVLALHTVHAILTAVHHGNGGHVIVVSYGVHRDGEVGFGREFDLVYGIDHDVIRCDNQQPVVVFARTLCKDTSKVTDVMQKLNRL